MNEQELNKKLAEWVADEWKDYNEGRHRHYRFGDMWYEGSIGRKFWKIPEICFGYDEPPFTQSLDACFKWLVPEAQKQDVNLRIVLSTQGRLTTVEIFGSNPFDDDYPTKKLAGAMNEKPALALCKAIEKLIDAEAG